MSTPALAYPEDVAEMVNRWRKIPRKERWEREVAMCGRKFAFFLEKRGESWWVWHYEKWHALDEDWPSASEAQKAADESIDRALLDHAIYAWIKWSEQSQTHEDVLTRARQNALDSGHEPDTYEFWDTAICTAQSIAEWEGLESPSCLQLLGLDQTGDSNG